MPTEEDKAGQVKSFNQKAEYLWNNLSIGRLKYAKWILGASVLNYLAMLLLGQTVAYHVVIGVLGVGGVFAIRARIRDLGWNIDVWTLIAVIQSLALPVFILSAHTKYVYINLIALALLFVGLGFSICLLIKRGESYRRDAAKRTTEAQAG